MAVIVIGLSHRTAPVEVRERFAFADAAIPEALGEIRRRGIAEEAAILSTCNRVEIYAATQLGEREAVAALRRFLVERSAGGEEAEEIYAWAEPRSVEHLFAVASGLDSMVLGETEILGQLKKAYELALRHKHTGPRLNKAFQKAFNVAKQIRTETNIQRGSVSVGSVAVELAEKIFSTLSDHPVMVIGAGETSEKTARALLSRGAKSILVSNRSHERAVELARELNGEAILFEDWGAAFGRVDIVISATAAPHYILDRAKLEPLMKLRKNRPLLLIDIAAPRDIDPAVNFLENVYLYNIDDLQGMAEDYLKQRQEEVARCLTIIREKAKGLAPGGGAAGRRGATAGLERGRPRRSGAPDASGWNGGAGVSERPVIIATRGSALALAQANLVLRECRQHFRRLEFERKIVKTSGDKLQAVSMSKVDAALPKGLFTKELEVALDRRRADIAVHSLKDLPTELPPGLMLGGVAGRRADVRDVLIYRAEGGVGRGFEGGLRLADFPGGLTIGTSSTRRKAQLLAARPDFKAVEIRGNVATRLQKLAEQPEMDATVLAAAGLGRLHFTIDGGGAIARRRGAEGLRAILLTLDEMLPCVGQGAIGLETRVDDKRTLEICGKLNDAETLQSVTAERAFLRAMGGGCQSPVGAYACVEYGRLRMRGISFLTEPPRRAEATGEVTEAVKVGEEVAGKLK